jgi:hypothetical protein
MTKIHIQLVLCSKGFFSSPSVTPPGPEAFLAYPLQLDKLTLPVNHILPLPTPASETEELTNRPQ